MGKEIKRLSDFWKKVLQESEITENRLYLKTQMDRKQYMELNTILELLWGKWNRWQKCHIFGCENLQEAIDEVCDTMEVVDVKILYQQFYTPRELSKRVVELADIKSNEVVLEPSAWIGNIIQEIWECVKILAIEIDNENCNTLKMMFGSRDDIKIFNIDFMDYIPEPVANKIVMNPPFTKSQDVKHILKAYKNLCEWWRLVSVASSSIQTRQGKIYDELRELNPEFIEIEEWSFKESWTMVNTVIVVINR